ncbi:MAG: anhydro-N-acetylmuramic acid kinase [Burkholderiales bacterium]|nr:anhydro-N-acetylmuramic acid kinase [Burkholderiales bacterium]
MRRFIGLMSGTSLDAVDAALLELAPERTAQPIRTAAFASRPLEADLRQEFIALQAPGHDELARAAVAANRLADAYAAVVADLLARAGCAAADIVAVGAHGQTVRHRPDLGYTLQLLNPARLAETCGIAVVSDLRAADVAAGGQGAPLVPAFHAQMFRHPSERRAVVNLGGIANVSLLPPGACAGEPVLGYDTGPSNLLLDHWCRSHTGSDYDDDGRWARGGRIDAALLDSLLADPWFGRAPPKSTGRELFGALWLERALGRHAPVAPRDVQATLVELTAVSVARACRDYGAERILVCGGGARNGFLVQRLAAHAAPAPVATTQEAGIDPQAVEAAAFAWLAAQRVDGAPGNLASVTGARGPRVLGVLSEPRC